MRVLVVGSGARENALCDALLRGNELFAFMSSRNSGIYRFCRDFVVGSVTDVLAVKGFAERVKPDLAVIGPEAPLEAGVVDALEGMNILCFGPRKSLARLETSKSFTRELMERHGIRGSPEFRVFGRKSSDGEILDFVNGLDGFVVKPDGLTGGKGVRVSGEHVSDAAEGLVYCREVLKEHSAVVIEEKLDGEEFSLQSITDGETVVDCPVVQDHKRAFDGDTGPNTGGMGSYSNKGGLLPFLKQEHVEEAHGITVKVARALNKEFGPYRGVMYGGFMLTSKGVRLIEYNARFGDPEAMNVLPLVRNDFSEVCAAVAEGRLNGCRPVFEDWASVCKYVVPKGYPDSPVSSELSVPDCVRDGIRALTFYASVEERDGRIFSGRSRAVAFVGIADDIASAERIAEDAASRVGGSVYHRKDIGTDELVRKRVEHVRRLGL